MQLPAHRGGGPRLDALKQVAANVREDPCLRLFALVILSIVGMADVREIPFIVEGRGDLVRDHIELQTFFLGAERHHVFVELHKVMGRRGRARACIKVGLDRNGHTFRLTRDGVLVHEDDPAWDDATKYWMLDESHMDEIGPVSRKIALTLVECGLWHAANMGGMMPRCETCPHQYTCLVVPQYLIKRP